MKKTLVFKTPPEGTRAVTLEQFGGHVTWRLFELFQGRAGEMAAALGISVQQLLHIRNGKIWMSAEAVARLNKIDPEFEVVDVPRTLNIVPKKAKKSKV